MDLDSLFGDSDNGTNQDTIGTDAEVQDVEELADTDETEEAPEEADEDEDGIGWKVLALFIAGGLVVTALVVAFMVWVIEGLVL